MNRISEIQVVPVEPVNGLVGFASFVFEGALSLSSIGILKKLTGGYRLAYPLRKNTRNKINFFYPINKVVAEEIEIAVITKFEELIKHGNE